MQELCLSVLVFRENSRRQEARVQQALSAAVAAGRVDPASAWPDLFGRPAPGDDEAFPTKDADMSGFEWEDPGPERAAAELEEMMHGARVSLSGTGEDLVAAPPSLPPEPPAELRPGAVLIPGPDDAGSLEWG